MRTYEMLPWHSRYLLCVWALALLPTLTYCFFRMAQQRRRVCAVPLLALGADYFVFQMLTAALLYGRRVAVSVPFFPAFLAAATALVGVLMPGIVRWQRTHISPMSMKESADSLPLGLCYSRPGGLPKLTNARMEALCRGCTGAPLLNADAFWEALRAGYLAPGAVSIQAGEQPIVQLPEGVYSFRRCTLTSEGLPLNELIAVDVTREHLLSTQLQAKQTGAARANRRLKELNSVITAMTIEKETLRAKTRLHDELGKALLSARRWLRAPESVDRAALLAQWRHVTALLKNEGPNAMHPDYVDVVRDAYLLGVEIETQGVLPELSPARELTETALSVCLTNTLRHAGGTKMFVSCAAVSEDYRVRITNDGRAPEGPIREGGGLGDLRRRVERAGGTMTVESAPRFALELTLPKEER